MIKRAISICLAVVMLLSLIPAENAYGAASMGNVTTMRTVTMNGLYYDGSRTYFSKNFIGADLQNENAKPYSVLYDYDPTNAYYEGNWSSITWDDSYTIKPGERHSAGIGFVVNLEAHNMLGSAMKGQLTAYSSMNYQNYWGDNDWGAPFIATFDSSGNTLEKTIGTYVRNTEWEIRSMMKVIQAGTKYVMFGGSGYRRDGVLNKNLDLYIYAMGGSIWDYTAPQVQSIESQNDYIRQKDPEPLLFITMSEDIRNFSDMKVLLTASDGTTNTVGLDYKGKESFNYSNGDVKYKFRIKIEELINQNVKKNFTKLTLSSIKATDTFGNTTTNTQNKSINKRIDTMMPEISYSETAPNSFTVSDYFGLSKVNYTLTLGNISNTPPSVIDIDPTVTKIDDVKVKKSITHNITNTTQYTGLFTLNLNVWDLAKNNNTESKNLFMISDNQPVSFKLMNSNEPMFAHSPEDVASVTDAGGHALTNMYLQSDISSEYLGSGEVYYKWHNSYDENILNQDPVSNKWNKVSFLPNSNNTTSITIPVQKISEGLISYLKPAYELGYLYLRPSIDDDTTQAAVLRTGSMALNQVGSNTDGKFNLITGSPVKGNFVNRGCDCTGQDLGETVESHYGAIRNHSGIIGLDITHNHSCLSGLKYFISPKDSANSFIDQGSIVINTSGDGKYNIPLNSISGKTGSYTLTAALYSNKGDVTVQTIDVNIESPIISVNNILYNKATKNLDFTVSYKKDSVIDNNLNNIEIEICDKEYTEFQDVEEINNKISLYSAAVNTDWDNSSDSFVRTEFTPDANNSTMISANFRASLSNMEKAGDSFIKASGEKRVHLKYITSNKVETVNNNITIIKKSNLPPDISKSGEEEGKYFTATEYNSSKDKITIDVNELIVDLKEVYYSWSNSAGSTLINTDGTIRGQKIVDDDGDKKIQFIPEVEKLIGNELYQPIFLQVYAENSADKTIEKTFGPFYVLNEQVNDKRFIITLNDKIMDENHVLATVDDRLHMVEGITKADKLKVIWVNGTNSIENEYSLSFMKGDGEEQQTTNVSIVNIPYPELTDTDGAGGIYKLEKVEIYNSADNTNIFKSLTPPSDILQTLPEYFVKIENIIDGIKVTTSMDEISYSCSTNPYDIPTSWTVTRGAITGINLYPERTGSLIDKSAYIFIKYMNNNYRSDKIILSPPSTYSAISGTINVILGEALNGYYGPEDGIKDSTLVKLSVIDPADLNNLFDIKVIDKFGGPHTINVKHLFKISDTDAYGFVPGLITSGGAIQCEVFVNGVSIEDVTANWVDNMSEDLMNFSRENRSITLDRISEHSNYKLYDESGKVYLFDSMGKTEIYNTGNYLLVYKSGTDIFGKIITINNDINYNSEDVEILLSPSRPSQGKLEGPVTAKLTMPYGSVLSDKYGVISNVENTDKNTVVTAVITRSAIYGFNIKFADGSVLKNYQANVDYIIENLTPETTAVSPSAISYNPVGTGLTNGNVIATMNLDSSIATMINNNHSNSYTFNRNGKFSFIIKDTDGTLKEHIADVIWIDKKCPEPTVRKYVWIDTNSNGKIDVGEKGIEIPDGYTTRYNVAVEINFPQDVENSRPVKLSDPSGFEIEDINGEYAYNFILAYKPDESLGNQPKLVKNIIFTDTLGNTMEYGLIIDEIDRTNLLVGLNYSTTNLTNSDVVVSMSSNKKIWRYDIDSTGIEKSASPTYIFRENGTKDFNYREIEVTEEPEEGKLTANVTWIDKSVPSAEVQYDNSITKNSVEMFFMIINGKEQGARLYCGSYEINLADSGNDRIGSYTVSENKTYQFEIRNLNGNRGNIFVPISNIDKTAPEISIIGKEHIYIKTGSKYYDPGATALDNRDGNITNGISTKNMVNTSTVGTYKVAYNITDMAGNNSERTRYVHVLDIYSAVAIVNDNVIYLDSAAEHSIDLQGSNTAMVEFVGIDGIYAAKYSKGTGYDNGYFKTNGAYMSKFGTFTAEAGSYTLYVQDQERNTWILKLNFIE